MPHLNFSLCLLLSTAYLSCPAHIEIMAEEKNQEIAKETEESTQKVSKKVAAQLRAKTVKSGGGVN